MHLLACVSVSVAGRRPELECNAGRAGDLELAGPIATKLLNFKQIRMELKEKKFNRTASSTDIEASHI